MDASKNFLYQFIGAEDAQFIIPVYQRNYSWKIEQCQQLLRDILAIVHEAENAQASVGSQEQSLEHFLGSIVYVPDGGEHKKIIIDGQQRLTTVTLLYIALANMAQDEKERERIRERYLVNGHGSGEGWEAKIKLRGGDDNDAAMRHLLLRTVGEYDGVSRLVDNYRFFAKEVAKSRDAIEKGLKMLSVVKISVEKKDNPQRIFESMNSTGLVLSQADLIRNYILMNLSAQAQNRIYDNYWRGIESSALDDETRDDRVTQFIRHFLTIKERKIPSLQAVYQSFKKWRPQLANPSNTVEPETEEALEEMCSFARLYGRLLNPGRENDREIRIHLEFLKRLEVDVSHPFLLEVYRDYEKREISREEFIQALEIVQSYIWRRFIVGLPTAGMNKTFMTLYQSVNSGDYVPSLQRALLRRGGKQQFPSDEDVLLALKTKDMYHVKPNNRDYFLERMENYDAEAPVIIQDNPKITVEHIFPQNPAPAVWLNGRDEDEIQWMRDRTHTVANLALTGNNGSLGNKSFLEKRDMNMDGGQQGYRFSNLPLTRALEKLEKWGKDEMLARMARIQSRFLEIWPFPSVDIGQEEKGEFVDIFEVDTLDSVRKDGFTFFEKKYGKCTVSKMYQTVIGLLFDLAPEKFLGGGLIGAGGGLGGKIKLTRKKEGLIQPSPKPLGEGYYYELNSSSEAKLKILQALLTEFELEEELQVRRF